MANLPCCARRVPIQASTYRWTGIVLRQSSGMYIFLSLPCSMSLNLPYRFLYAIFLCLDANFRLKNNLVSNFSSDPGLGIGMAYMIPHVAYSEYVLSQADAEDVRSAFYCRRAAL